MIVSCQISPAASPETLRHTVWRTWLFIAYSDEGWLILPIPLPHFTLYFVFRKIERTYFLTEFGSERVNELGHPYNHMTISGIFLSTNTTTKRALFLILVYQQMAILHPKCSVSFPRIPFPETIKLRIRGIFCARKNSCRMCHYEGKCREASWLRAREALWSNCQWIKSRQPRSKVAVKRIEIFPV